MPAAPRSSSSKKAGAPKAKGAVRAKSGCYTCRIRRKKCDEQPNDGGDCQTCVRLRLECLGFGAKRPEWLRENSNVVDLRVKIKGFLGAQGMIKGHSSTGQRSADHEPPKLRLSPEEYSSSSESPPTPTLSLPHNDRMHSHTSSLRDESWISRMDYNTSGLSSPSSHLRAESPYGGSSHSSIHDNVHYSNQLPPISYNQSNSLVLTSPAIASSFSTTYTFQVPDDPYDSMLLLDPNNPEPSCTFQQGISNISDHLFNHYMLNVLAVQYLLADRDTLPKVIYDSVASNTFSYDAACLLSSVHWSRKVDRPHQAALDDRANRTRYDMLVASHLHKPLYVEDDVVAALHVVSMFLFDGGRGPWEDWLNIAKVYVERKLYFNEWGNNPAAALMLCNKKIAFIIKTTLWFDVLASVTIQKPPRFLDAIRLMFSPLRSGIHDPSSVPPQYSMMNPMGCENHIVWALAETSALSVWKQTQITAGCLSVPELVAKAAAIELTLAPGPSPDYHSHDDLDYSRHLTSDIFRASTRVYLRSVVSGDYPSVSEIAESVDETMECIKKISDISNVGNSKVAPSVVRSTVFGFFICGSLSNNPSHQKTLLDLLDREMEEGVGNCSSIREMLISIWKDTRHSPKGSPVQWRERLQSSQMLLV